MQNFKKISNQAFKSFFVLLSVLACLPCMPYLQADLQISLQGGLQAKALVSGSVGLSSICESRENQAQEKQAKGQEKQQAQEHSKEQAQKDAQPSNEVLANQTQNLQKIAQDRFQEVQRLFENLRVSIISSAKQDAKTPINLANQTQNLSFMDFIFQIADTNILLLGEKHDEKSHHKAQLLIMQALDAYFAWQAGECKRFALVLEMLGSEAQSHIDEASKSKKQIQRENLKTALGWGKWDYQQYKDIVEYAFYTPNFDIIAGNLSRQEISTIYKGAEPIAGNVSTSAEVKERISKIISKSHKTNDATLLDRLTQVQQYKDRRMADMLFKTSDFALLLAGNYHITKTFGIPLHIEDFLTLGAKEENTLDKNAISPKEVANIGKTAKTLSVGMLKAKYLTSKRYFKKYGAQILSQYDYILLFR